MKILFVSQYCSPEQDLKKVPFAAKLKELGHEVEILTGYPNYPLGKIYPGYKNNKVSREKIQDVDIIRVPLYPNHTRSAIKRAWNYLSFALSATFLGMFYVKKPDIIYAYHAPATIAIPALWFKLLFRCPVVYDINDYWPDSLEASGMIKSKLIIKFIAFFCRLSYRFFDKITVVSDGFKEKLLEDGVPSDKIHIIYNWPHPYGFVKSEAYEKIKHLFEDYFPIVYTGNIGSAQQLSIILDVSDQVYSWNKKIRFFLVGDGIEKKSLQNEAEKRRLKNVFFIDIIPLSELGVFFNTAGALFLHLKSEDLFKITIPSKLFSYLSAGKPIISGVTGEANNIVKKSGSGVVFESENSEELLKAIESLLSFSKEDLTLMGDLGIAFFEKNFSLEIGVHKFQDIFFDLYKKKKL